MQILYSQPIREKVLASVKEKAAGLIDGGKEPHLAVVLVGDNQDSWRYVNIKSKQAKEVGITISLYHLPEKSTYGEVEKTVAYLAEDPDIKGIIIQLPLPDHFTETQVGLLIEKIPVHKDVDGLRGDWKNNKFNALGEVFENAVDYSFFIPPLAWGVAALLNYYKIDAKVKRVVIVGGGRLVGQPLLQMFKMLKIEAQLVDEDTEDILRVTKQADILISGTGQKNLITYQWIKEGAVVVDCAADIHADSVQQVAAAVSPSVGGVGPLTVVWLLMNTVTATAR